MEQYAWGWQQIILIFIVIFFIWVLYKGIKSNKNAFSKESIGKSFSTMGVIALLLIAFIAFCIFLLRAS